ncbi:MAG: hypothetical protein ACNI27_08590 [Desulfovibrio sp.]
MLKTGELLNKSRSSIKRIQCLVEAEQLFFLDKLTHTDQRYFKKTANTLNKMWQTDGGEEVSRPSFVAICISLVDSHRESLPDNETKVRTTCDRLEGMLFTLYKHFDPELTDDEATKIGERIANEYQSACAA